MQDGTPEHNDSKTIISLKNGLAEGINKFNSPNNRMDSNGFFLWSCLKYTAYLSESS